MFRSQHVYGYHFATLLDTTILKFINIHEYET